MIRASRTGRGSGLKWIVTFLFIVASGTASAQESAAPPQGGPPVFSLISWLLKNDSSLENISFSEVIAATSGRKILPIDMKSHQAVLTEIGTALDQVLTRMNAPDSPVRTVGRINEVSRFFEDAIVEELNGRPGFHASFPLTAAGTIQRAGYPDIQLETGGAFFYLDPKLYAAGSRDSTFRTFYFEPKSGTNKVTRDAVHLVVGIEHDFAVSGRFLRWELIDLSSFRVRLKAEFEGSNASLYRNQAVVGKGEAK